MYLIGDEEIAAVTAVLRSQQLFRYAPADAEGHLHETTQLEAELGRAIGVAHALALTSGCAALISAMVALEIGPGDEVLIPGFTFVAAAAAPLAAGAIPVIVEIDDSLTIDVADAEKKITERTRAIVPTHMYGLAANMDALVELGRRHGIAVIEDACQCAGGTYRGRPLGSIGRAGCLSFNHFKAITSGEGGALLTDDARLYERARIYHDPGVSHRYRASSDEPIFAGVNYRFNELQAALLRVQLRRLGPWVERLKAVRERWSDRLRDHAVVRPVPLHDPDGGSGTHLVVLLPSEAAARRFARLLAVEELVAVRPTDSGRHVYHQWECVMNQRAGLAGRGNPFEHPSVAGKWSYHPAMCPETLGITARAVAVALSPLWDDAVADAKLAGLVRAAARV